MHDHHPPKYSVGIAVFAISAIVEVQDVEVVQVPLVTGPRFGKSQERAKESR